MKKLAFIFLVSLFSISCVNRNTVQNQKHKISTQKADDGEWDLTVFDPDFDTFMASFAKPKSFYTLSYLKNKNTFLTSQWNMLYYAGRYRNIIESNIDYDPTENYGFDYEYKLYQVFVFVKWKYGLRLDGLVD